LKIHEHKTGQYENVSKHMTGKTPMDSFGLGWGPNERCCDHSHEYSGL